MLEEVDIRMSESKRDTRDFKKDVVVGGENPRTGRTSTEKFIKFAFPPSQIPFLFEGLFFGKLGYLPALR